MTPDSAAQRDDTTGDVRLCDVPVKFDDEWPNGQRYVASEPCGNELPCPDHPDGIVTSGVIIGL